MFGEKGMGSGRYYVAVVVLLIMMGMVTSLQAKTIIISTSTDEILGGLSFQEGDLVSYDIDTSTATLFLDDAVFTSGSIDIDAVHVLANGHILLSTENDEELGGLSFGDADIVEYDPIAEVASMFFDGSEIFSALEDVDACSLLDNGHIILSTATDAEIGSCSFTEGDLVEYDPVMGTASIYFDGDTFALSEDIDAVDVLENGAVILAISTETGATIGGVTFEDGDLVEYNMSTGTASLFFDEDWFDDGSADIDALYVVPEPATMSLLALAGLALIRRKR